MAEALTDRLRGIFIPAVTPFDAAGGLDLAAFERNLARWDRTAVRGYLVLGSNGEFRSLSDDEALAAVGTAARLKGDKTLLVGAGRESLVLTCDFVDRLAQAGGVDAVAVLTPHYFARLMSQDALVGYYAAVADRSPLPVLVYVAPAFANGVALTPESVAALAGHPNVVGIKENDAGRLTAYLADGPRPDFAVLAGSIGILAACLEHGGSGGVVSAANYLPDESARAAARYWAGETAAAHDDVARLADLASRSGGAYGVAGVKAAMDLLGYDGGVPRLPVLPVSDEARAAMRLVLTDAGLL